MNYIKTKTLLKLSINRLKLLQQKLKSINQTSRKEISKLLSTNKPESARIKVEHIILQDYTIEALELLELYIDTLLARFGLLENSRHCDPAISEAVNTIIYSAPRVDVPELLQIRDQLLHKYGKEFGLSAMENVNDVVSLRMIQKLKISTPDYNLVTQYLVEIANAYNVEYQPPIQAISNDVAFTSIIPITSSPTAPTAPTAISESKNYDLKSDSLAPGYSLLSNIQSNDNPQTNFPTIPETTNSTAAYSADPDFDELEKRFQALKKK